MAISSYVLKVFGAAGANGERADYNPNRASSLATENITATFSRKFKGPTRTGHGSLHFISTSAALVATMTFWVSNMPDPDETNDAHWVAVTAPASINLAASQNTYVVLPDMTGVQGAGWYPEWIRAKITFTSGAGTIVGWWRGEDVTTAGK